jgi:3-phosphoshikimate 1-carboxyvinyltransferase
LILGALARGESVVTGLSNGEDVQSTASVLRSLGVPIAWDGPVAHVRGVGIGGFEAPTQDLDCGNSGTTMRLMVGLLASQEGLRARLVGDASLSGRPMERVSEPLRMRGATVRAEGEAGRPPLVIEGAQLAGYEHTLSVASAQVKSCLLLAGLQSEGPTAVIEPGPTRDHTERMLLARGADIQVSGRRIDVLPQLALDALDSTVPGDLSSGAFFLALGALASPEGVTVEGIGLNDTRTGVLEALGAFGVEVRRTDVVDVGGEPVGSVTTRRAAMLGAEIAGDRVVRAIDEIPILAVTACFAEGTTRIRDAAELRVKESDRIAAIAQGLRRMGADIEEAPDGMTIRGGRPLHGAELASHGDHRVAMALAIAALQASGPTSIDGVEAVDTSFPGFVECIQSLLGSSAGGIRVA